MGRGWSAARDNGQDAARGGGGAAWRQPAETPTAGGTTAQPTVRAFLPRDGGGRVDGG